MRCLLALFLAISLAAAFVACGGTPGPGETSALVYVFRAPSLEPGLLGKTFVDSNETTIQVRTRLDRDTEGMVLAHELYHAVGYLDHAPDTSCISYEYFRVVEEPCPFELERMRAITGTYTVQPSQVDLYESCVLAAHFWNRSLGRTLFVVHDPRIP